MRKLISAVLILMLVSVMTPISISALPVMEGHKAPEFVVIGYDSNKTAYVLDSHRLRNRTVVVVFFAYYCPHCRNEMKNLIKAWDLYANKSRDVMILVGVGGSAKKDWDLFKANCREGWYFVPENYTLANMFKVDAVPAIFVMDGNWTVRLTHIGEMGMAMLALAIQQVHRGPWTNMPVTPIEKFVEKNKTKAESVKKTIKSNIPENANKYFLIGTGGAFIVAVAVVVIRGFHRERAGEGELAKEEETAGGNDGRSEGSEEAQDLAEEKDGQTVYGDPEA